MAVKHIGTGPAPGAVNVRPHRDLSQESVGFREQEQPGPDPGHRGAQIRRDSGASVDFGEGTKVYGTGAVSDQKRRGQRFKNYK